MKEGKKQERNFELRSEKVCNIVGEIPSSLIRYGITAIGVVLLCLFAVAYFLPYKQIYSGTATVCQIANAPTDSIDIHVLLRFENKRTNNLNVSGQMLHLQATNRAFVGQIQNLSPVRDTLERQEAHCRFKSTEIKSVEKQTMDFRIILSSGNLLQKMLGDIGW